MNNSKYWSKRAVALELEQLRKGEAYYKEVEKQYNIAIRNIEKEIADFHTRFANNNELNMFEARKLLNSNELEEFKWTVEQYIDYGRKNAIDPKWTKELENASIRVRVSRLEALKLQLRQQVESVCGKQSVEINPILGDVYTNGYYKTMFEIQKGLNIGFTLQKFSNEQLEKVLAKPWALDGKKYSSRIWDNRDKLAAKVETYITQAVIKGDAPDQTIKVIADQFKVSKRQAGTLVMTETAAFTANAQLDAYKALDIEQYEIVATLDTKTSEICRSLDGKVFSITDYRVGVTANPFHPNCRTTTAPYFEDNPGERIARGIDGKTYYVPNDMKYKEWYNRYVKENIDSTGLGDWPLNSKGLIQPTKILENIHYSPKIKGEPNAVIQYINKSGGISRDFYDSNGWLVKQIHNNSHSSLKAHPFGVRGEHAHYWKYDKNNKLIPGSRDATEIEKEDIDVNIDIMEWLK